MFHRSAQETLSRLARGFPVLALTGPRQSGKTTLAKMAFPDKPYLSLEDPDIRTLAESDPRGLLAQFPEAARKATRQGRSTAGAVIRPPAIPLIPHTRPFSKNNAEDAIPTRSPPTIAATGVKWAEYVCNDGSMTLCPSRPL